MLVKPPATRSSVRWPRWRPPAACLHGAVIVKPLFRAIVVPMHSCTAWCTQVTTCDSDFEACNSNLSWGQLNLLCSTAMCRKDARFAHPRSPSTPLPSTLAPHTQRTRRGLPISHLFLECPAPGQAAPSKHRQGSAAPNCRRYKLPPYIATAARRTSLPQIELAALMFQTATWLCGYCLCGL
jgi:hypothetical protein